MLCNRVRNCFEVDNSLKLTWIFFDLLVHSDRDVVFSEVVP